MHVCGFSIVRNAVHYDYPIVECLQSLLPLVDELVVAVGNSCDETRAVVESIGDARIRIVDSVWDDSVRQGGNVLAQQTDYAMQHCDGDWLVYLQADEVLHEADYPRIRKSMQRYLHHPSIEGLSFRYHHFRADYAIRDPLPYRRQVRIIRGGLGIQSHGDACGFRLQGRKLHSASTGAWVYHYGYVKPPKNMSAKMDYFKSLYDGRRVDPGSESEEETYAWDLATCEPFLGSHPEVMQARILAKDWETPQVELISRWRNPKYWGGMVYKNSRTLRRWAHGVSNLHKRAA